MNDKKTLLIVDDDIAHRTMLRILLTWEYEIFEADDGLTAIDKIRERPFDLVIMDVRMKRLSGMDALDRVKDLSPATPVVMMTAYWTESAAAEARQKGAFDYLSKPFDFNHLKATIQRAVAWGQAQFSAV
jgi:two-component system response regulator HydG